MKHNWNKKNGTIWILIISEKSAAWSMWWSQNIRSQDIRSPYVRSPYIKSRYIRSPYVRSFVSLGGRDLRPGDRGERYPNWFNSIFEFCQKMIQFKKYSIQKNCKKIQVKIWFKMLNLAGFNSTIYSFNNKTWVSLTPTWGPKVSRILSPWNSDPSDLRAMDL